MFSFFATVSWRWLALVLVLGLVMVLLVVVAAVVMVVMVAMVAMVVALLELVVLEVLVLWCPHFRMWHVADVHVSLQMLGFNRGVRGAK